MASASSQYLFQSNHSSASVFPKELLRIKDMTRALLGSRNASSTAEHDQSRRLRTSGKTVSRSLKGFDQDEFKSYLSGLKSISGQQHGGKPQRKSNKPIDWGKLMENEEDLDIKSVENDDANYFLKPTHSTTSGATTVLYKPEEKGDTRDGNGTTTQKLIQEDHADTKKMTSISYTSSGRSIAPASTKGASERKAVVSVSHQTSTETSEFQSSELDSSFSGPIRQHFYTICQLDTDLSVTPKMIVEKRLSDDQELDVSKSSDGDGHSSPLLSAGARLVHANKSDAAQPSRMTASEKRFQFSAKSQFDDNDDLVSPSTSGLASAEDSEEDSTDIQESIVEEVSEDTEKYKDIQESILEEHLEESSLITTEENRDKDESMVNTEDNMEYEHAGILGGSSAYTLYGESSFESESDKALSVCIIATMSGSGMSSEGTPSYTLDFSNGDNSTGSHIRGRSRSEAAKALKQILPSPLPKPTKISSAIPPAETATSSAGRKLEQHKRSSVVDTGTQTLTDDTANISNFHSWPHPSLRDGPYQFGGQYLAPPPAEELTTHTPNMLALNDMLRSQLRLTRRLLTTHRSLLASLTSSLRQDYRYTTLQDTKCFIQGHKPKVLTLSEAKRKSKHK